MPQEVPAIAESAIADTVAAVFRAPELNPGGRWGFPSLFWWTKYLDFSLTPALARTIGLVLVGIVAVIAVIHYTRKRMLDREPRMGAGDMLRSGRSRDAWTVAQE